MWGSYYIILTIGDIYDDDDDAVTQKRSETENSVNPNESDNTLVIQPDCGSGNENYHELFNMEHEVEGAEVQPDQVASQMNHPTHFKKYISESTEQDFCSSPKEGQPSPPRQNNLGKDVIEEFYEAYHRNQIRAFQHCFQDLQDLIEQTNRQFAKLNGIFIAMQKFWERSLTQRCTSVATSIEVPPPGFPSVANSPDRMNYSDFLRSGNMSPDTTFSSVCLLSHFDMPGTAEASLENNSEARNYPPVLGNDIGQRLLSSSPSSLSDSVSEEFVKIEIPENMENSSEDSLEILSCPSSLESDRDQSFSSSLYCTCTNYGMLGEKETGFDKNLQTMNNLHIMEYESEISPYSSMSSSPSSETSVETGTNMKSNSGRKNRPKLMRNYGGQHPFSSSVCPLHRFSFGYIGYPFRCIKIPNSVIDVAKSMCRPEHSAKYLLHHLFTDDVLIRSNVYGSLEQGLCALDSNRINALREFLQDTFPVYDLEETGCDWQLCVIAIDNCIRSFRSGLKNTVVDL
ncbi:BEN domain-containing protein 2 [Fukomys damarensis]|uniref:BEN domain-containing protein 2 n=1 Tax=Fukomys damarensis TaxID=885580 RepID=UPI00053FE870|nr:BEN domain-containing protein 2 [Fukomys damarensis]